MKLVFTPSRIFVGWPANAAEMTPRGFKICRVVSLRPERLPDADRQKVCLESGKANKWNHGKAWYEVPAHEDQEDSK